MTREIAAKIILDAFNHAIANGKVENVGLDIGNRSRALEKMKENGSIPENIYALEDVTADRTRVDTVILASRQHPGVQITTSIAGKDAKAFEVQKSIIQAMRHAGFEQSIMPYGDLTRFTLKNNHRRYAKDPKYSYYSEAYDPIRSGQYDQGPYVNPYSDNSFSLKMDYGNDREDANHERTFTLSFASNAGVKLFQQRFDDIIHAVDKSLSISIAAAK